MDGEPAVAVNVPEETVPPLPEIPVRLEPSPLNDVAVILLNPDKVEAVSPTILPPI